MLLDLDIGLVDLRVPGIILLVLLRIRSRIAQNDADDSCYPSCLACRGLDSRIRE